MKVVVAGTGAIISLQAGRYFSRKVLNEVLIKVGESQLN